MKKILFWIGLSGLFFSGCLSGEKDVLRVGMELAYPPFEMTDTNGTPAGISVDMAYELGEYLGRPVQISNISFDGLIPSLKTGKIDMIISSMTITEERSRSVTFSNPYSKAYLALLLNRDSPVESAEDLNKKGRVIAVKKGTTGHLYARENLPSARINVFDKESACVLEVVQGKADAFIYDQMTIFTQWQKNLKTTRAVLEPFQDDFEYWGIAMRKGDLKLQGQVNAFLLEFKKSGGFERLAEKYLSKEKEIFESLGIPFFFSP